MKTSSPTLPGFAPESPEMQIRKNVERGMIKYQGDVRAYFAKLLERAPEARDKDRVPRFELLAARRRPSADF